jgi:hypothetical protein
MNRHRPLPVREHLKPKPRRNLLANLPKHVRTELPDEFVASLGSVLVFERVDPAQHHARWGYDCVATMPVSEAEELEVWGKRK